MPLSAAELEQLYDQIAAQELTLADATAGYELDDIKVRHKFVISSAYEVVFRKVVVASA